MSANVKNLMDKMTDKEIQVIKTYNRGSNLYISQKTNLKIKNL